MIIDCKIDLKAALGYLFSGFWVFWRVGGIKHMKRFLAAWGGLAHDQGMETRVQETTRQPKAGKRPEEGSTKSWAQGAANFSSTHLNYTS